MPLVRLLKNQLIGTRVYAPGSVVTVTPQQAESYRRAGAGVVVPEGTVSDPETPAVPEHETEVRKAVERAAVRSAK